MALCIHKCLLWVVWNSWWGKCSRTIIILVNYSIAPGLYWHKQFSFRKILFRHCINPHGLFLYVNLHRHKSYILKDNRVGYSIHCTYTEHHKVISSCKHEAWLGPPSPSSMFVVVRFTWSTVCKFKKFPPRNMQIFSAQNIFCKYFWDQCISILIQTCRELPWKYTAQKEIWYLL